MKRVLSLSIAVLMLISMLSFAASAEDDSLKISASAVKAVADSEAVVTISLADNPGFVNARLSIAYDSTYLSVKEAATVSSDLGNVILSDSTSKNPYVIYVNNGTATEDITVNGDVATIKFAVAEGTPAGTYPITITASEADVLNQSMESVPFEITNGSIKVGLYGDVTEDGKINRADSIRFAQYSAGWSVTVDPFFGDVTGDGKINRADTVRFAQYSAGWNVVLGPSK